MISNHIHRSARLLGILLTLLLVVGGSLLPQALVMNAATRSVTIFGPITIERSTGKPLTTSYHVTLPSSIVGPFSLQVRNGPDRALRVTSARIIINGIQVLGPSDFKKRWASLERQVNLQPTNLIDVAVDAASKPGSRLELTLVGIDTTPEEVVLAEEQGTIGPEGGILALPDVGEVEFAEDATRPSADFAIRKIQAPALQDLFCHAPQKLYNRRC